MTHRNVSQKDESIAGRHISQILPRVLANYVSAEEMRPVQRRKPAQRPKVFYRGYDVIDTQDGGYIAQGAEAQRVGFRYDTREWGNDNKGHEYGTDLSPQEKEALLAYLKTL